MFSGYSFFLFHSELLVYTNSTFHGQLAYHVTNKSQWCCNLSNNSSKFDVLLKRRSKAQYTHTLCLLHVTYIQFTSLYCLLLWWIAFLCYILNGCCTRVVMLLCSCIRRVVNIADNYWQSILTWQLIFDIREKTKGITKKSIKTFPRLFHDFL